eukprot:gene17867-24258_t
MMEGEALSLEACDTSEEIKVWCRENFLELSRDALEFTEKMAHQGGCSEMWTGTWRGQDVAIKCVNHAVPSGLPLLRRELGVMRISNFCDHVCRYLGFVADEQHFYIVMRKYRGSLRQHLKDEGPPLKRSVVQIFKCTVVQVFKCTDVPVFKCTVVQVFKCTDVHVVKCTVVQVFKCTDVQVFKCTDVQVFKDNVLMNELGDAVLTDFGISRIVEHDGQSILTQTCQGTPNYMAPEHLGADDGFSHLTFKIDVW